MTSAPSLFFRRIREPPPPRSPRPRRSRHGRVFAASRDVEGEPLVPFARGRADDEHIGPYRILRRLEMNNTSETVLAVCEGPHGFERTVAIKRLLPHAHSDPKLAKGLGREATAYARLTHPAILRLYDYFAVNDEPAMVLEFVDGVSLARL